MNFGGPSGASDLLVGAAHRGRVDAMKMLLDRGVDPNQPDSRGGIPIWSAAFKGRLEACELLVQRGADVNANDEESDCTAIVHAAGEGHLSVVRFLLKNGATMSIEGGPGPWPLGPATAGGHQAVVELLLDEGCSPRNPENGFSILRGAITGGNPELVEALLDRGLRLTQEEWRETKDFAVRVGVSGWGRIKKMMARSMQ